jgi:hypothetical protein
VSLLLQQILVGVLVLASALFGAWRLASIGARLRVLEALDRVPGARALPGLAQLRERTLARQLSACGGCAQSAAHGTRPAAGGPAHPSARRRLPVE